MAKLQTYAASMVVITYKGVRIVGMADGEFIKAKRMADSFSSVASSDGAAVARAGLSDKRGEVSITLLQTSSSNDFLSREHALDEASYQNTGALVIKDLRGTTLAVMSEAWIKTLPDVTFGKDVGTREWNFEGASLDLFAGGNI